MASTRRNEIEAAVDKALRARLWPMRDQAEQRLVALERARAGRRIKGAVRVPSVAQQHAPRHRTDKGKVVRAPRPGQVDLRGAKQAEVTSQRYHRALTGAVATKEAQATRTCAALVRASRNAEQRVTALTKRLAGTRRASARERVSGELSGARRRMAQLNRREAAVRRLVANVGPVSGITRLAAAAVERADPELARRHALEASKARKASLVKATEISKKQVQDRHAQRLSLG